VCDGPGISKVNPPHTTLLFERFISRERNEPPDIDVDFEHERRGTSGVATWQGGCGWSSESSLGARPAAAVGHARCRYGGSGADVIRLV
jgi:hypothetical protein